MRKESSLSAEVTFLDNAAAVAALSRAAAALVDADANVRRVLLFGSLALGQATPQSDADVIVVVDKAEERFHARGDDYRLHFLGAGLDIGVELLVYTEEELARLRAAGNQFIKGVLAEAVTLAARP